MESTGQQQQQTLTLSKPAQFAIKRLYKDWRELEQEKESLTNCAALPTSSMFVWHCNLCPDEGPYASTIFHLILTFPENYPHSPPDVKLCSCLPHPNIFGDDICLDMIQEEYAEKAYMGWTSAYSILGVLLQLQSFLFAENIAENIYGFGNQFSYETCTDKAIMAAREYKYENIETMDGTLVTHAHNQPWPPLSNNVEQLRTTTILTMEVAPQPRARPSPLLCLPTDAFCSVFSFLTEMDLLRAQNVCGRWGSIVTNCNLLQRTQIQCFHSKATLDNDNNVILGVGLTVEYDNQHRQDALKSASSPLDLLSLQAFEEEGVRTGVWRGATERFTHFLPLVLNPNHARSAVTHMECTILDIMKNCPLPNPNHRKRNQTNNHNRFHPKMAFQLLAVLMNSMVVELMNSAPSHQLKGTRHGGKQWRRGGQGLTIQQGGQRVQRRGGRLMYAHQHAIRRGGQQGHWQGGQRQTYAQQETIQRHASEKALEGYCAFYHMLLYFAKRYPSIMQFANYHVDKFLAHEGHRHKTPDLGILLVCLTLSQKGWNQVREPLVMEAFDRSVRCLLQKYPCLDRKNLPADKRLELTFEGAKTSLRLLMFQAYFLSHIGRPANARGHLDVLARYDQCWGKPTAMQKDDLHRECKAILEVNDWRTFFVRLGGPVPPNNDIIKMLLRAVNNRRKKRYH